MDQSDRARICVEHVRLHKTTSRKTAIATSEAAMFPMLVSHEAEMFLSYVIEGGHSLTEAVPHCPGPQQTDRSPYILLAFGCLFVR